MIDMTVEEALEELTQANFHSEHAALANRITALENALRQSERLLTSHAAKVGPLHAWWDTIFDIRALLKDK